MPLSLHLPQDILGPGSEVGVESFSSTTASLNSLEYASLAFSFRLEQRQQHPQSARTSVELIYSLLVLVQVLHSRGVVYYSILHQQWLSPWLYLGILWSWPWYCSSRQAWRTAASLHKRTPLLPLLSKDQE
ncbi:hypothetical protein Mapa_008500 [Marchantia paleacea]|nr:hypothetical protein Mapa_008500 [Marchantia paleacea]